MDVLTWVRQSFLGRIPVVFITAQDSEEHIVAALQAGADDYLVKPPRRRELIARVQAVGRRAGAIQPSEILQGTDPYVVDVGRRVILLKNQPVELTSKEFDLAAYMFANAGRLVKRGVLLERVWGRSQTITTRTVDAHISRIRKKLEIDESNGWRLISVYQHGYRMERSNS